jgi:hypothetical protein
MLLSDEFNNGLLEVDERKTRLSSGSTNEDTDCPRGCGSPGSIRPIETSFN